MYCVLLTCICIFVYVIFPAWMPNWNPGQNRSEDERFAQPSPTLNNHVLSTCLTSFCLLCTVVRVFAFYVNGKQVCRGNFVAWTCDAIKRMFHHRVDWSHSA